MNDISPSSSTHKMSVKPAVHPDVTMLEQLYERYASSFYGEIKRSLYNEQISAEVLMSAFQQIGNSLSHYDEVKGGVFAFCFRILRREIQKRKVELVLKEIFACQRPFATV